MLRLTNRFRFLNMFVAVAASSFIFGLGTSAFAQPQPPEQVPTSPDNPPPAPDAPANGGALNPRPSIFNEAPYNRSLAQPGPAPHRGNRHGVEEPRGERPGMQPQPGEPGRPRGKKPKGDRPGVQPRPGEPGRPGREQRGDRPGMQPRPGEPGRPPVPEQGGNIPPAPDNQPVPVPPPNTP